MKVNKFYSIVTIIFISCTQNIEIQEYQPPMLNLSRLKNFSINEKKEIVQQIATKKQIIELFIEKLNTIVNENVVFTSSEERKEVFKLLLLLDTQRGTQPSLTKEDFDHSIFEWVTRTKEKFLWNHDKYIFLLNSLETDYSLFVKTRDLKVSKRGFDCECNTAGQGIIIPDCAGPDAECLDNSHNCNLNQIGCGTFWLSACDGNCKLEI